MSESEDYDDTDSESGSVDNSFGFLTKVKSNTPRARFDIHFYPTFIKLIQYNVRKEISNRYRIDKEDVSEMLRLPYSNNKQIFFVLHLKSSIIGGNKSTTEYDFVVFNFAVDEYDEIRLDITDNIVKDMFSEDIIDLGYISGPTIDIFEDMLVKIFAKDVITPAKNYVGSNMAPALKCTFWDSDEHFLYALDNGFINVWKYCQKLKLSEVKNVRFVRSQGRSKTFDFYIYPSMNRLIRRYHIGFSKSQYMACFFLEFKAIDQMYYDGLYGYCERNKINISIKDFKESASGSSDSDSEQSSRTETETNASGTDDTNTDDLLDDGFEAPDPHMVRCRSEGRGNDSETNTSNENSEDSEEEEVDTTSPDQPSTLESQNEDNNSGVCQTRRNKRRQNIISDESDSTSADSIPNCSKNKSHDISPRKRSLRIESDDDEVERKIIKQEITIVDASESD